MKAKVELKTVTPADAQIYLMHNTCNRPISEKLVKLYLKDMRRGKWLLTTDAIGFDKDGNMINGQHRLTALVRYNKAIDFLVATHMDHEAFNVIDTGKFRTAGDILAVNGVAGSGMASSICKGMMIYRKNGTIGSRVSRGDLVINMSNQDILNFAQDNKGVLEDSLRVASGVTKSFKGIGRMQIGVLYWVFSEIDKDAALEFMHQYSSGTSLSLKHPIRVLRERLITDMGSKKKYPERDKCAWAVIAWNNFRKKRDLTSIRWDVERNDFPKPI